MRLLWTNETVQSGQYDRQSYSQPRTLPQGTGGNYSYYQEGLGGSWNRWRHVRRLINSNPRVPAHELDNVSLRQILKQVFRNTQSQVKLGSQPVRRYGSHPLDFAQHLWVINFWIIQTPRSLISGTFGSSLRLLPLSSGISFCILLLLGFLHLCHAFSLSAAHFLSHSID